MLLEPVDEENCQIYGDGALIVIVMVYFARIFV